MKELRMEASVTGEILRVFEKLPDPRGKNARHKLIDVLTIALCGVICGAGDWVAGVTPPNASGWRATRPITTSGSAPSGSRPRNTLSPRDSPATGQRPP